MLKIQILINYYLKRYFETLKNIVITNYPLLILITYYSILIYPIFFFIQRDKSTIVNTLKEKILKWFLIVAL